MGDRYRIIDTLGEGGMSNVYLAEDIILQRKVAVKVLRLDLQNDPQTLHRFQREALATSELSHPNIVSVLDVGTDQGSPYMVMEYVSGPNLKQYLRQHHPLKLSRVIQIMDQILSAVILAHQHNVIHRDLKPENILMDDKGNVKIADFGIAVALNQSLVTQTNTALGSVHYMAPEQTRGGMVTKQSDIYSLGIILYELISGKTPFNGDTAIQIAMKHLNEQIPNIHEQNPNVPQSLANVILKAAAKDPRDRYSSAYEMKKDLDTCMDPSRRDEPAFVSLHDPNQDKTIAIPSLNDEVKSNTKSDDPNQKDNKKNLWQNIKEHKWWWIGSIFAVIVIIILLIYALGRNSEASVPNVSNLTTEQAESALETAGLKVGDITETHSNKIKKGRIIKTLPSAGSLISKGKTVDLIVSSGEGLISVPDVTGLSYTDAKYKLEKLDFTVVRQDSYSDDVARDNVIEQNMAPGEKVKAEDTTIVLTVSKGPNKSKKSDKTQVKLRDLSGYSLKSVQDYAHDNGLNLQVKDQNSDTVDTGIVISQDPAAGTTLSKGDNLTVTVSKGKSSQSKNSSSSTSEVSKSFTVPYTSNGATKQGNHVQIYISDNDHDLSNAYKDLYITRDTSFTIPFTLSGKSGHLRVVEDGKTIIDESVTQ